jgi:hypothetical protein
MSPSTLLNRPFVLGVALPSAASTPRYLGTRQTGDRDRIASQGLPHLLAMAITPFWTIQDECRNPRPDPPDERCQPSLGRASHPWRIAQARRRYQPGHGREVSAATPQDPLPDLAQLYALLPAFYQTCCRGLTGVCCRGRKAGKPAAEPRWPRCNTLRNDSKSSACPTTPTR